jgi:hypothetical protein
MELKKLSPDTVQIPANGKIYILETDGLSIERFWAYQKYELECGFDIGYSGIYGALNSAIADLQKPMLVDAGVTLVNARDGMKKTMTDKYIPSVNLCSLFLNTKDEDRRWINDEMLAAKQKDFEEEGIASDFFLVLAKKLIRNYRQISETKV